MSYSDDSANVDELRASLSAAHATIERMRGERDQMKRIADKFQDDYVQARAERDAAKRNERAREDWGELVALLDADPWAEDAEQGYGDYDDVDSVMLSHAKEYRAFFRTGHAEIKTLKEKLTVAEAARDRAVAEGQRLREALENLIGGVMGAVDSDSYRAVFDSARIHGVPYTGPNFSCAMAKARAALSPTPATGRGVE